MSVKKIYNEFFRDFEFLSDFIFGIKGIVETEEFIHPFIAVTLKVIDSFIKNGKNKILIVTPDEDFEEAILLLTYLVRKVFTDIEYAGYSKDKFSKGEKVEINGAIVEFLKFSDDFQDGEYRKFIHFLCIPDKKRNNKFNGETMEVQNRYYSDFQLQKASQNAQISEHNEVVEAFKKLENQRETDKYLSHLKDNRTHLEKTVVYLTMKKRFIERIGVSEINREPLDDFLLYGEFKNDELKIFNSQKNDGIPAITIFHDTNNLREFVSNKKYSNLISAVFINSSRSEDLVRDLDTLDSILPLKIPTIVFLPESMFSKTEQFKSRGFESWIWNKQTLSDPMLTGVEEKSNDKKLSFFRISQKILNLTKSDTKVYECKKPEIEHIFSELLEFLRKNSEETLFLKLNAELWNFYYSVASIVIPFYILKEEILKIIGRITEEFNVIERAIKGQLIEEEILKLFSLLENILESNNPKYERMEFIMPKSTENYILVLPEKTPFFEQTTRYFLENENYNDRIVVTHNPEMYYRTNDKKFIIIPFFYKNDYFNFKNLPGIKQLNYILYSFEKKWFLSLENKISQAFSLDSTRRVGEEIGFDFEPQNEDKHVVDFPEESSGGTIDNVDFTEKLKDNFDPKEKRMYSNPGDIIVEAREVQFCGGYSCFYPKEHKFLIIDSQTKNKSAKDNQVSASLLESGDRILTRESGRDVIRDTADLLLKKDNLADERKISKIWVDALSLFHEQKGFSYVKSELQRHGIIKADPTIRLWLSGQTIGPKENIMKKIGIITGNEYLVKNDNRAFQACETVRNYHIRAGNYLSELINKNIDSIKSEFAKKAFSENPVSMELEDLGKITIYTIKKIFNDGVNVNKSDLFRMEKL